MAVLTSELILKLDDQVSGAARRAAKSLATVQAAMVSLQRTGTLGNGLKRAEAAAEESRRSMDRQQKALAAAAQSFGKLGGNPLRSFVSAEETMRRRVEETTRAIDAQARASKKMIESHEAAARRFQRIRNAFSGAGTLAGPIILHGAGEAARAGASVQRERVRLGQLGGAVSPAQAQEIERQSLDLSAKYRLSQADLMHTTRNAVTILGDAEEALKLSEPLAKLRVIASARGSSESVEEDFDKLIKGLEIKGVTQDPKQFQTYMEGIAKGLNAFGDTLKPYQYYEMFKYGRQATPMLSERFMLGTAPALGQELGGSSFGNAVSGFNMAIVGGVMKPKAAQELYSLGLVDEKDLYKTKTGLITGVRAQSVHGWQTAQEDPYAWVKQFLSPALTAQGHTSKSDIMGMVPSLFSNRVVAQMMGILLTQQPRIDKDMKIQAGAGGLSSANDYLSKDPFAALKGLSTSLETFSGVLTSPVMEPAARTLDMISGAIGRMSVAYGDFAKEHPQIATALGASALAGTAATGAKLTFGLFDKIFGDGGLKSGFGMTTAATQLEASAAALQEAAVALGAKGGVGAAGVAGAGAGSSKAGAALGFAAKVTALGTLAEAADSNAIFSAPKRSGMGALLEMLDPGLADRLLGPVGNAAGTLSPMKMRPADALDRVRERNNAIFSQTQAIEDNVGKLGALDTAAQVLKASFDQLSSSVAGLGAFGSGGGGGGLINASFGGGGGAGSMFAKVGGKAGGVHPVLRTMVARAAQIAGVPLSVYSGFRSPGHNAAVGGAAHSLHMNGWAADLLSPGHSKSDSAFWGKINGAMGQAAREMGQPYRWGGNFGGRFRHDNDHFDLGPGGPVPEALPRRRAAKSIEAKASYSPTIHIHVAGDLHNGVADRIANELHRHYEDAVRASYSDTQFA